MDIRVYRSLLAVELSPEEATKILWELRKLLILKGPPSGADYPSPINREKGFPAPTLEELSKRLEPRVQYASEQSLVTKEVIEKTINSLKEEEQKEEQSQRERLKIHKERQLFSGYQGGGVWRAASSGAYNYDANRHRGLPGSPNQTNSPQDPPQGSASQGGASQESDSAIRTLLQFGPRGE